MYKGLNNAKCHILALLQICVWEISLHVRRDRPGLHQGEPWSHQGELW